jgi:hypothetical protein
MSRPVAYLIGAIVFLSVLVSAGPTLVRLAHVAISLIAVVGIIAVVIRIVWHFTSRY